MVHHIIHYHRSDTDSSWLKIILFKECDSPMAVEQLGNYGENDNAYQF